MISFPQQKMASRVGASILYSLDLQELVVETYEDYEELAVRIATQPSELKRFQEIIMNARISSLLFNSTKWVENFEKGLLGVLRNEVATSYEQIVYVN